MGDIAVDDVDALLARLRSMIEGARSMPMSSSAMIHRGEVLELVAQIEKARAGGHGQAAAERDQLVTDARSQAEDILAEARNERDRLVSETEVFSVARREAEQVTGKARSEAEALRRETDDYVDRRLANFEITLTDILAAVTRGRNRLKGRSELDQESLDAAAGDLAPPLPGGTD